jgi:anaphase-promoting complex subunit 1
MKNRTLRLRLGQDITYGNHMAIGMGIGLLFLGGGVYTLSTSNVGIAGTN